MSEKPIRCSEVVADAKKVALVFRRHHAHLIKIELGISIRRNPATNLRAARSVKCRGLDQLRLESGAPVSLAGVTSALTSDRSLTTGPPGCTGIQEGGSLAGNESMLACST